MQKNTIFSSGYMSKVFFLLVVSHLWWFYPYFALRVFPQTYLFLIWQDSSTMTKACPHQFMTIKTYFILFWYAFDAVFDGVSL